MRIGVRWGAGTRPHPTVPVELHEAIEALDADGLEGSWTLTWLEGLPVCTRSDDAVITLDRNGSVVTGTMESTVSDAVDGDDDDDWLSE
ncbi:Fe-S oxidoreductase [Leucobacter chinensis]|uniref:Fe-S oxidoreductase n=1 Tax=Leucobacter chinensis TaxID=2851010 RepID=UPI001C250BC7|nr:Fe-S oxidoreductase [Leucobacter chinensis]